MSMKNSDTIGNRSRDLPVCSTVPQPLRYRHTVLPTSNKVIIKCTAHHIVHLQCTFSLPRTYASKRFWHFIVGTGTKEDESGTGRIWAAGFQHAMGCSHLARVLKLVNQLVLQFPNFFSVRVKPRLTEDHIHHFLSIYLQTRLLLATTKASVFFLITHSILPSTLTLYTPS
jgi:hypothetical protein